MARLVLRGCDSTFTKGSMTMSTTHTVTKDPVCGMTVDPAKALHADRNGKTSYFCSDSCMQKFLSASAARPDGKS
jgi:Cu+-exporting ATPase